MVTGYIGFPTAAESLRRQPAPDPQPRAAPARRAPPDRHRRRRHRAHRRPERQGRAHAAHPRGARRLPRGHPRSSGATSTSTRGQRRPHDRQRRVALRAPARRLPPLGKHFSVNAMVQRDSVREAPGGSASRASRTPSSRTCCAGRTTSWALRPPGCTLQVGGERPVGQHRVGHRPHHRMRGRAHGLTVPLVSTTGGEKMGKTADGAVWLDRKTRPSPSTSTGSTHARRDVRALPPASPSSARRSLPSAAYADPSKRAGQRRLAEVTRFVRRRRPRQGTARDEVLFRVDIGARSTRPGGGLRTRRDPRWTPRCSAAPKPRCPRCSRARGLFRSKTEARTGLGRGGVSVNNHRTSAQRVLAPQTSLPGGCVVLPQGKALSCDSSHGLTTRARRSAPRRRGAEWSARDRGRRDRRAGRPPRRSAIPAAGARARRRTSDLGVERAGDDLGVRRARGATRSSTTSGFSSRGCRARRCSTNPWLMDIKAGTTSVPAAVSRGLPGRKEFASVPAAAARSGTAVAHRHGRADVRRGRRLHRVHRQLRRHHRPGT